MASRRARLGLIACILPLATCAAGCGEGNWKFWEKKPTDIDKSYVETPAAELGKSASYRDTIGEQGWIEGLRFLHVRGYGLVAGLGTRGSRECPKQIRDKLIQELYKRPEFSRQGLQPAPISPEKLIDDLDTAVVVIEGDIPAAAPKGTTFDVKVAALTGTQTVSLEGGRLYTANLHIYREEAAGSIEGQIVATAAGPVFINPFVSEGESSAPREVRSGVVIGGGVLKESRKLRLVMTTPSYQRVQAISDTINGRFPHQKKLANATSPSYVELRIPSEFNDDPFRFIALVRHLYLPKRQGFGEERARKLAEEILDPEAPHADIALAFEGIGRTISPIIEKLYTAEQPHARFYAALAGMRMGDDVAVDVIERVAGDSTSSYRLTAIEELGRARKSTRAALVLRRLLNDPDPRIRVEAYEALLARKDHAIESRAIANGRFTLDVVPSNAEALIYIRRTGAPRIALIGQEVRCAPPLFYQDPNESVTLNAEMGDSYLTVIRRAPFGHRSSPALKAPQAVDELVAMLGDEPEVKSDTDVHGLALDYSTITHALYELCKLKAIDAKFMMQTPSITEMYGPLETGGRRESDL
jgi:hypothetical protein